MTAAQAPSCLWGVITYLYTLLDFPVYQSHAILSCVLLPSFMQTYMLQLLAPNRRLYTHSCQSSSSDIQSLFWVPRNHCALEPVVPPLLSFPSLHAWEVSSSQVLKQRWRTHSTPEWRLCHLLTDEDASICSHRTPMSWYFFATPLMKSRCKFYQKKKNHPLCGWTCSK